VLSVIVKSFVDTLNRYHDEQSDRWTGLAIPRDAIMRVNVTSQATNMAIQECNNSKILCVYVKSQASTCMFTAHYCFPPDCTDFTDMDLTAFVFWFCEHCHYLLYYCCCCIMYLLPWHGEI